MRLHVCIASRSYYWILFCAFPVAFATLYSKAPMFTAQSVELIWGQTAPRADK